MNIKSPYQSADDDTMLQTLCALLGAKGIVVITSDSKLPCEDESDLCKHKIDLMAHNIDQKYLPQLLKELSQQMEK